MNREKDTHPSYGMLSFGRTSRGKETILFGSSIPHRETIRLTIAPGVVARDLNNDWYFTDGASHIEVEMSQAQFAEAITSLNQGSGVPVTIRRLNGKGIEEPEFTNKRIQFEREFEEKMKRMAANLEKVTEMAEDVLKNKKTINKSDREAILNQIYNLRQEIGSNIPFVASQFNEQLDKTVTESKAEIEATIQSKLNALGLQKLEELTQLAAPKPDIIQIDSKS